MARVTQKRKPKRVIYVFWEGESEKEYSGFLGKEFEECAVINCHHEKGTFQTEQAYYRGSKAFRNNMPEIDEVWFFFDTEDTMAQQWDENMKCLKSIKSSHPKKNPLVIRLLMTRCCIEYWLLLHFEKSAPALAVPPDKMRVLESVRKYVPKYAKGDRNSIFEIAQHYPEAVKNGQWRLTQLEQLGMPQGEKRDEWLYRCSYSFTTVHEAIQALENYKKEFFGGTK